MNLNIDFNLIIKKFIPFFIIIISVMIINFLIYLFLPKDYFPIISSEIKNIEYKKYKFKENFEDKKFKKNPTENYNVKKEYNVLSNFILQMIYKENDNRGWIVLAEKASSKVTILGINETYKKYTLDQINANHIILRKNGAEYKLKLSSSNTKFSYINQNMPNYDLLIENIGGQYQLKRELLYKYTKNSSNIWKEISLKEVREDNQIIGFKVVRISKESIFIKLGLLKNDILKSVNNIMLKNYANTFSLYNQVNKLKNVKITLLRGKEEVELEYEIK